MLFADLSNTVRRKCWTIRYDFMLPHYPHIMIKKSITVTEAQEAWIQAQVAEGKYATDSEVIREALREKQERIAEVEALRSILIKAEASGTSNRTAQEILAASKAELRRNGAL